MNEKFGWRRNIPRELPLTSEDRRNIRERFAQRRGRMFWKAAAVGIVFILGWFIWKLQLEVTILGRRIYGWYGFGLMAGWIVMTQAAIGYALRKDFARIVRTILRERGYDICIKCGYWLRGLDDNVQQCPECGAEREITPTPGIRSDTHD